MRFALHLVLCAWVPVMALGCSSKENSRASPAISATSLPAVPPPAPREPAAVAEEVTFETEDDVLLAGDLYLAKDPAAPLLVLIHRYRGDRKEWAKVEARLASSEKRYTVVVPDLRGHGASRRDGKKRLDWADMTPKDMPAFVRDVHAAIRYGFERALGKSNRVVLVGSSLGAAFAARAASEDARAVAVGLVSPGAAIEGYDVYHPFASVRMLPSFLAGAREDNVSKEPLDGMSRMAKELATVKSYEGRGHGAFGLLADNDTLARDLEAWLMQTFEAQPVPRDIVPRDAGKKTAHKGPLP